MVIAGNSYQSGRHSTDDLLARSSLDLVIFISRILIPFVKKQATLMRRSTVLSLPLQLVFPGLSFKVNGVQ
jgi:hypothetical protein